MGIGITVLDFYQKSLKTAVPQTFLKKGPPLTGQISRPAAGFFAFLGHWI